MQNDDRDKISELYTKYEQEMYYEARKILHDDYLAEDAVHEAFLRLIRNRDNLRETESPQTKAYIRRTLQSSAIDIYRKNKRDMEHTVNLDESTPAYSYTDNIEYTTELIEKLPQKYSSVIRCRLIYGLTVKETSAVLKLTENCVKKRYERARAMLADIISKTI